MLLLLQHSSDVTYNLWIPSEVIWDELMEYVCKMWAMFYMYTITCFILYESICASSEECIKVAQDSLLLRLEKQRCCTHWGTILFTPKEISLCTLQSWCCYIYIRQNSDNLRFLLHSFVCTLHINGTQYTRPGKECFPWC